jgi:hypothetical protein
MAETSNTRLCSVSACTRNPPRTHAFLVGQFAGLPSTSPHETFLRNEVANGEH